MKSPSVYGGWDLTKNTQYTPSYSFTQKRSISIGQLGFSNNFYGKKKVNVIRNSTLFNSVYKDKKRYKDKQIKIRLRFDRIYSSETLCRTIGNLPKTGRSFNRRDQNQEM